MELHILYASDENYVRHAAASMLSLFDANKDAGAITVHFLSMGIGDGSREALQALATEAGRRIEFHTLGDIRQWFDFSFNPRGFSQSVLARLFVARFLPDTVDRVLYIDCDTVVTGPLAPLFEINMGGYYLGMIAEPTVDKSRRKYLGMRDEQPYFNSGVLLINLKLWREEDAEGQVLGYYKKMGGNLVAPDQDALNGAFAGRIMELPPMYNYGSVQIYYPWLAQRDISWPTPFMDEETYKKGTAHPAIIHFLGEERPWREGNRHPYTPVYEKYLSQTPWAGTPQETGWKTYFRAFYLFNRVMKHFPYVRWLHIDHLIPVFMKYRERKLKKLRKQTKN